MSKIMKRLYLVLIFAFLYAPIIVLIVFSFNEGKTRGNWEGFSLAWYKLLMQDQEVLSAVKNTFLVATVTTIVSTFIGTLGAIGISLYRHKTRQLTLAMNQVNVINPDIVIAIGLMVVYRTIRLEPGLLTLILAHVGFTVPYVVLSVMPKIRQMSRSLPEAAMDLGATPAQTFWRVIIPQLKPGIISGALIAFTLSVDDFVISFFNVGNGVETISTIVYSMARRGINPVINALSTLMFVTILILMIIMNLKTEKEA